MITSQQARTMFENTPPERWSAAVQTLIVQTLEGHEEMEAKFAAFVRDVKKLAKVVMQMRDGTAPAAPAEAVAGEPVPEEQAAAPASTDEAQAQAEAMMDAAIRAEKTAPRPANGKPKAPASKKAPAPPAPTAEAPAPPAPPAPEAAKE